MASRGTRAASALRLALRVVAIVRLVAADDEISLCASAARAAPGLPDLDLGHAFLQLKEKGYARVRLGADAPWNQMEGVVRTLMGSGECGRADSAEQGAIKSGVVNTYIDRLNPSYMRMGFHNEMAHAANVPTHVAFAMVVQSEQGGTTLLADNVEVTAQLSVSLRDKMLRTGVGYMFNYRDERDPEGVPGGTKSWQQALRATDLAAAVRNGSREDAMAWVRDTARQRVTHAVWSPLFVEHPVLGWIYFGNFGYHASTWDAHRAFRQLPYWDRPFHSVWGDGTEFSTGELEEIRSVIERCAVGLQLEQGDVLVVDNLRVQHDRTPFVGDRVLGLFVSEKVQRLPHRPPAGFRKFATEVGRAL